LDSFEVNQMKRWGTLLVINFVFLTFAFALQSVPPVLYLITAELDLSYAQAGLLMSLFALPGIIISIPAGHLSDHYGQKNIGIASLGLIIIGSAVFASGDSFIILAMGRIISGIGAMTISVIAPQLIAKLFTGRQLGIAMGIFTAMMPLGTVLSLNLLSLLGESFGWRTSIWLCVLITVVALILFAIIYSPAAQKRQEKLPESMSFVNNLGSVGMSVWLLSAIWMFYNGVFASITTFTPIFLKVSGFIITEAGFLTSIIMLPSILLSPVFGLLIGRFSRKSVFIIAGSLIWTIVVLFVPISGKFILAPMILLGLTSSLITVPTYVLIAEVTDSEKLGLAYGIMSSTVNVGILAGPALAGFTIDITHSYQASYYLDSGFALMIALSAIMLFRKLRWISSDKNSLI